MLIIAHLTKEVKYNILSYRSLNIRCVPGPREDIALPGTSLGLERYVEESHSSSAPAHSRQCPFPVDFGCYSASLDSGDYPSRYDHRDPEVVCGALRERTGEHARLRHPHHPGCDFFWPGVRYYTVPEDRPF